MKRRVLLVAGIAVLLLVGVALALEFWPCPNCECTPMTAYNSCPDHIPPVLFYGSAYINPENPPPPPARDSCPQCKRLCDADSVLCPNCDWSWHR